jgi:aspartyl-tRNA(Asn)/glutamyl-tRNA(Gln) amidotransferase subunit C
MATITREQVLSLAELSKVTLTEEEVNDLQIDLTNILEYLDQLSEIDTENVEPTYLVNDLKNVLREDKVREPLSSSEQLLSIAPDEYKNQIKVPKVL